MGYIGKLTKFSGNCLARAERKWSFNVPCVNFEISEGLVCRSQEFDSGGAGEGR